MFLSHRALAPAPRSNGMSAENVIAEHLQRLLKHYLLHQVGYHALVKLLLSSILEKKKSRFGLVGAKTGKGREAIRRRCGRNLPVHPRNPMV